MSIIDERYEGAVVFDGLEDAIVGFGQSHGGLPLAVYSEDKIIRVLESQGMSTKDAIEHYCFNIQCLYAGTQTPLILTHEKGVDT